MSHSHADLDALIAIYFAAVERGETPDRQRLIADHPALASELTAFFADLDQVQAVAAPLQLAGQFDETLVRPDPLPLPETIRYFGEYELLEEIARGGMGVVYKAKQESLNRIVALKMVLRGTLATPVDIARFKAEAEASAQLDHPHIVPIYEVGEHDGRQYFTMKLIDGPSLSKVPRGSVRDEVARLKLVVEAVQYAHQHGILHRDLKPGNILVDREDVPYVVDFGLAKRLTDADLSLTETNQLIGTPRYMAPEQASGSKSLTTAADVYALGTILYERLTGEPLFPGDNFVAVLDQVRAGHSGQRLADAGTTLGRDLRTILEKCLDLDPTRRYQTCQQLAEELDRWLRGTPILSRPVGNPERLWRWCQRNPTIASLITTTAAALLIGTCVSTYFAISASKEAAAKTKLANDNAALAEKESKQRDKAERHLVGSLLRPIGYNKESFDPAELRSFVEWSALGDSRLQLRGLDAIFDNPETALRLARRADHVIQASVGLSPVRRAKAIELVSAKQRDMQSDPRIRIAACWFALELGSSDLGSAHQ